MLIAFSWADNREIDSIQYKGLHRLTKDALTPWTDLAEGDKASEEAISKQIKKFYESQYFESISSSFDGGKLVFTFVEELRYSRGFCRR